MDWVRDVYPCNAPRALRHLPARAAFTLSARNGTVLNLTPRVILHREAYETDELEADIHAHRHIMTHRDTWQTRVLKLLVDQRRTSFPTTAPTGRG